MTRRSIESGKAVIVIDVLDKANASFNKLTSKMMASARGLRNLGQQAAGAGLLTGLVSRGVINNFVEFEDKILNLTAKLGIFGVETNQQKANIKDLTKTIIDLGRVTSYTSAEVADAAISLAQAGFSITEIKSSLKAVLDLARGTGYALGDTADLLANTVRTFNLLKPGNSAAVLAENMATINHVASMMVKATRLGTIEIQDLRESMKYAGGTSVNLGANLSTVLGLLVQMSESGLKASLAGTSMNTAFLNLANNLEQLQGRLPKFQLFMSTLQDGTKGVDFGQTLKSLMDATKGMDRMDKVRLFGDVFNIRGSRMVSSVQDMERVEFFIKEIAAAGEEAALAAAKMESGLGGAIRRLTSGIEALNIAAGYTFKDGATAMTNFATVGVAALERLTASHKILVGALVFSPVIFIGIAGSAMILSVVLARLRTVLIGLAAAFNGLKRFGGFLGGSLMSAGKGLQGAMNARGVKAAAIKAQAEKVARMEAKINASVAAANARKTPASQATALAKINASKRMAAFKAEQSKLAQMTKSGIGGKVSAAGQAIRSKTIDMKNVKAEKAFYSSRKKTYEVYAKDMRRRMQYHETIAHNAAKNGNPMLAGQHTKKAAAAKNAAQSAKWIAGNAAKGLKGASYMKTLFAGLNMTKTFAALGKGVSMIFNLSKSFAILTFRLSRFVFSWNFVGLALNALLMFGHKIPFIRKAFEDVGAGFSAAFQQIARIATYAAPALKLFSLAFEAFVKGDTGVGVAAISAGFSGLVAIIQNQLSAAWNAFAAKVANIWVVLKQIGTVIWSTISALLSGLGGVATTLAGPLMQGLTDMFSGGGGGFAQSLTTVFYGIAIGLNDFITNFSIATMKFIGLAFQFVNRFHLIVAEAVQALTFGAAGGGMKEQAEVNAYQDDFNQNVNVGKLKGESMKRERIITAAFEQVGDILAKKRETNVQNLNNSSQKVSEQMSNIAASLGYQLQTNQMMRDIETQRLKDLQNRDKSAPGTAAPNASMKTFEYKLSALVGSIQAVSGNRLLKESPKEIELAQETNAKLDKLINVVQTQGM
jgi:TP901 family phage tail tape measure protein